MPHPSQDPGNAAADDGENAIAFADHLLKESSGDRQDGRGELQEGAPEGQLSEYAFRQAIERAVRAGLAACDVEGRQTYVNPAFCELVGWSEAELLGETPPFRYWPEGERARIEEAFRKTLAGSAPEAGFDLRFVRSDGSLVDVVVAVAPLVADDGSVQGWLASVTDITDQKQVQAALRASERQLMFTLESARVGTWDWDLSTNAVSWSENLELIHGMPTGSFGSDFESFLSDVRPDHRERVRSVVRETLESGIEYRIEYPVIPKDGATIWVEGRGRVIRNAEGRAVRMAGICMDITDRKTAEAEVQRLNGDLKSRVQDLKEAEQKLRELNETLEARVHERTEELEEINRKLKIEVGERLRAEADLERLNAELRNSNRELRDFVHAASHDLKEPLRKITYFVDLLNEDIPEAVQHHGPDYVDRIQQSAMRMTELINDLLAYAQLRSQEHPFVRTDLRVIAEEAVSDLAIQIQEAEGDVVIGHLPEIEGDPVQLRQLFQNLISNGLKFHRAGTPPVVRLSCGDAELRDKPACRIVIQDNGIGLDERYADRIFTPFQRLHDRESFPGSGMGLAICRRIVERHAGEIAATGTPGNGSSFSVTLPCRQPRIPARRLD